MSADQDLISGTGVRRHHTISASSRPLRDTARGTIAEEGALSNEDEVVDEEWVGSVGAVGEKNASLHRQASLPTARHYTPRGMAGQTRTPRHMPSLNSLSAIAGQEGDEEDWEKDMRSVRDQEEIELANDGSHSIYDDGTLSNLSHSDVSSPPIADAGVRRHQSMTANRSNKRVSTTGLRRSGTLQTAAPRHQAAAAAGVRDPSPTDAEEEYDYEQDEEEDPYADDSYVAPPQAHMQQQQQQQQQQPQQQQQQYQQQPMYNMQNGYAMNPRTRSPWGAPGAQPHMGMGMPGAGGDPALDDVQRALSSLELSNPHIPPGPGAFQSGQSAHPPRFNPTHPPPQQQPGGANLRRSQPVNRKTSNEGQGLALQTNVQGGGPGPVSAGAYMSQGGAQAHSRQSSERSDGAGAGRERAFSAAGSAGGWDQNRRLGGQSSNPNLQYAYGQQGGQNIPNVPPLPVQYQQQQQQQPRLGVATSFGQGMQGQVGVPMNQGVGQAQGQPVIGSPVDVPTLIATKGYNPVNFDTKPSFARYFVIKSYTEEDVHKSIKYEIWSSTDPGNKRLDKAFKETAGRGPIYLFFSVNASGHFCGMAEMLTPVDLTRSSTVWASDKWKGVFKVRWIFVRDIPNATLRHIKLNNTQERKPVTNSRDTQELLPDAGHEMLRIFHTHPARTSLLQDFSYYELQSAHKTQMASPPLPQAQARMQSPQPGPPQQMSPTMQQQHPYAMTNQAALAYAAQQQQQQLLPQQMSPVMGGMSPMMHPMAQMGALGTPYGMQNIMRGPSPGSGSANPQYMDMQGRF